MTRTLAPDRRRHGHRLGTRRRYPVGMCPPTFIGPVAAARRRTVAAGIAFRAIGTYLTFASRTSLSFAAPSGMVSGDYVLIPFVLSAARTITAPSGFTALVSAASIGTGSNKLYVYGGFWTSGTTFAFTWTGSTSTSSEGVAVAWSGVNATTPMDATPTTSSGGSTTPTAPSITTVTANAWHVPISAADNDYASGATAPSGYTKRTSGGSITFLIADKVITTAGATGTTTTTAVSTGQWGCASIALRPA